MCVFNDGSQQAFGRRDGNRYINTLYHKQTDSDKDTKPGGKGGKSYLQQLDGIILPCSVGFRHVSQGKRECPNDEIIHTHFDFLFFYLRCQHIIKLNFASEPFKCARICRSSSITQSEVTYACGIVVLDSVRRAAITRRTLEFGISSNDPLSERGT